MHEAPRFLTDLSLVLCVAALTTAVFQRLHQPVVLGYLLAGAIVGPHTPVPFFADEATIHALSELGVILLMFALGLELSLAKLFRVAPTAGVVAIIQCGLMIWLGYLTGRFFGWTVLESLYCGAVLAISSTTIIVKVFDELRIRGKLSDIVFGILIVEDLIAIVLLAILTTISSGEPLTPGQLATTIGRLAAFLVFAVGGGLLIVPRTMRAVVALDRPETTVVGSVGLAFGFALLAQAAGYEAALGAFLAGALVAESGQGDAVEHLVQPVRDIFAAIFFVSVGMLIDPALLLEHWRAVLVLTAVVVVGKLVGVALGVFLTGEGIRTAIKAGMSLAQIGEFSFIIAGVGLAAGATRPFLYPLAIAVSGMTTLLTPWLIRASDPVATYVDRTLPHPIQTFTALYGTWLSALRSRPREPSVARRIRRLARLVVVDAVLLGALTIATALWGPALVAAIRAATPVDERLAWIALVAAAGGLAVPFCVGIARCTGALARLLADVALPAAIGKADFADAPRRVLIVALEVTVLLVIGVPLVAITQPFLPSLPAALLMAAIVAVLGVTLWRSVANLQEHAKAGAQAIVEVLAKQARPSTAPTGADSDLEALHRLLPGLGAPAPIRVQAGDQAVGSTLAQLNLRGLSGATVLAIVRDGQCVIVPSGREMLEVGDLLAVAGTAEAIRAARALIAFGRDDAGDQTGAG